MYQRIVFFFIFLIFSLITKSQSLSKFQLKDSIEIIIKEKGIPGGILTVVCKDSVLFQLPFGFSDVKNNTKVQENDLFKIASLTKTFTAMAIMRLVNEGKLSLNDELKSVAPEIYFKNKWESTHPVRIKHLIEHKAGFNDYSYSDLANRNKKIVPGNSLEIFKSFESSLESNWKPGLVTSYSNPGFSILGYIIEKKSGKRYQDYIRDEILIPIGMNNSGFIDHFDNNKQSLIVKGYKRVGNEIVETELENRSTKGLASTGMISNIKDMSIFLQYFLNEEFQQSNPIIGFNGVKTMERLHSDFDLENKIKTGYNLTLEDRIFGEKEMVFKGNSGLTDGFVSNFIYNRELDIGVFASTNLFLKSNREIVDLLVNNYCETKEINNQYKIVNTDLSKFKDWEGVYRQLNDSQDIWNFINFPVRTKTLKIGDDELVISDIEDRDFSYQNVGENAFLDTEYEEKVPTLYLAEYEGEKLLRYYDNTYESTCIIGFSLLRIFLIFSLVILFLTTVLFIAKLIVLPFKKSIKSSSLKTLKFALPFLLIVLSVFLGLGNLSFDKIPNLGNISNTSITIFILTSLYPVVCIWLVYSHLKERNQIKNKYNKFFWSSVVFANVFICVYCVYMGWFGVRFWM